MSVMRHLKFTKTLVRDREEYTPLYFAWANRFRATGGYVGSSYKYTVRDRLAQENAPCRTLEECQEAVNDFLKEAIPADRVMGISCGEAHFGSATLMGKDLHIEWDDESAERVYCFGDDGFWYEKLGAMVAWIMVSKS